MTRLDLHLEASKELFGRATNSVLVLLSLLVVSGCGSTRMAYQPEHMELADALLTVEDLTYSQHRAFKPDYIEISSQYVAWGYGTVAKSSGAAVAFGNLIIGGSTTRSRSVGDRSYFRSIDEIQLLSWTRKGKQWYVVSITDSVNRTRNHVYRTRYLDSAERFASAMDTIIAHYRMNPETGLVSPWPKLSSDNGSTQENQPNPTIANGPEKSDDLYDELIKLDDLRKRGLLTDAEFESEKQKLLEKN